jgi:hypothetical protein
LGAADAEGGDQAAQTGLGVAGANDLHGGFLQLLKAEVLAVLDH